MADLHSGAALGHLVERLGDVGVDIDAVTRDAMIDLGAMRGSHERVSGDTHVRLWKALQQRGPGRGLGIELARSIEPGWFSVFDYVIRSSRTLGDAVLKAGRYARLLNESVAFQLEVDADIARLRIRASTTSRDLIHLNEFAVAGPLVVARQLCGTPISPTEARFVHARPADVSTYDQLFGCPLVFEAADNELRFPAEVLHLSVEGADTRLQRVLEQHAQILLDKLPAATGWVLLVQRTIEGELPHGNPHAINVAQQLGMSERTLRRRLSGEGASYQQVLDQVRHRLAMECIKDQGLSVTETAFRLGFSSVSAFSKAQKRWARA